jgi:hypothetical protein
MGTTEDSDATRICGIHGRKQCDLTATEWLLLAEFRHSSVHRIVVRKCPLGSVRSTPKAEIVDYSFS